MVSSPRCITRCPGPLRESVIRDAAAKYVSQEAGRGSPDGASPVEGDTAWVQLAYAGTDRRDILPGEPGAYPVAVTIGSAGTSCTACGLRR
jgi:hypothetical protein